MAKNITIGYTKSVDKFFPSNISATEKLDQSIDMS